MNPDGSHQVVSSVQDMWGHSRGMTSAPNGSSSSGRLIHDIWNDKTIEDKADEGRVDGSNVNEDIADEGKADEGNFVEGKADKGKTDYSRDVADDEGTQMNEVREMFVEPKEGN